MTLASLKFATLLSARNTTQKGVTQMLSNPRVRLFIEIAVAIATVAGVIFIYISQNNEILDLKSQVRELQGQIDEEERLNGQLFALLIAKTSEGDITLTDLEKYLSQSQVETIVQQAGIDIKATLPFKLETQFPSSGWMGDGEQGTTYLSLSSISADVNGIEEVVTRIEYRPGPKGWAGIYWQHGTWGDQPGKSLVGAGKITFLAKGENGGEIVEFKAGGIRGRPYEDTFEVSIGKIKLSSTWREYTIDLSNQDLSNVIGAFAWIVAASDNGNNKVTIYIADLVVDK
jgi:hypothetical protein